MPQVIMAVFIFAIEVFLFHWASRSTHGPEFAHQLIPRDVLGAVCMTLLFMLDKPWLFLFSVVGSVFFWGIWLSHVLRRSDGFPILLHWKASKRWLTLVAILLLGSALIVLNIIFKPVRVDDFSYVGIGILLLSFIPFWYSEKEAYITDHGIETGRHYICWEQIESSYWSISEKEVTHILFKTNRRLPIFNLVQLNPPLDKKDAVNEIVLRKLQHLPATSEEAVHT